MSQRGLGEPPTRAQGPGAPARRRTLAPQWDATAAVAAGGVLGAEARYGISVAFPHAGAGFPWATLCINVVGCFCLGALMATLTQLRSAHRLIRPFVGVGVLGGFTTFSTMAVDAERLIADQRAVAAGLYLVCTLVAAALAMIIATSAVQLTGPYLRGRLLRGGAQHERHSQGAERARGDADD